MLIRRIKWASPKNLAKLALLGVFTGGTSVCYYSAVSLLPSSAALTLLFQYIWISVLIECLHKKKLPATSTIIAVVITLVGTLFATGLLDGSVAALNPLGIAYGLGSALFYALFLYYSGTLGTGQPIVLRTTMLTAGGLLFTSIASPAAYTQAFFDPITWPFARASQCLASSFPLRSSTSQAPSSPRAWFRSWPRASCRWVFSQLGPSWAMHLPRSCSSVLSSFWRALLSSNFRLS